MQHLRDHIPCFSAAPIVGAGGREVDNYRRCIELEVAEMEFVAVRFH